MERRRTLGSEGEEVAEKEWKLLKTLTSSDKPNSDNQIRVTTDDDENPFSVDEVYMRITSLEKTIASYNDIDLGKWKTIGEIRGSYPAEVFIRNIAGFWRCFCIAYNGNAYSQGTVYSMGGMHYVKTKEDVSKITEIGIGYVASIEAKIYGR